MTLQQENCVALSAALHRLAAHDLRRCPEGEGSVPVRSSEGKQALDIGSFQYSRGNEKALHLCKALIVLAFLAPRPGLEPGTYGLTVGRSDRAAGRANAHFLGVRTSNTFESVSSISTGLECRIDYWILESFPPRIPGCSAVLFCRSQHTPEGSRQDLRHDLLSGVPGPQAAESAGVARMVNRLPWRARWRRRW